MLLLALMPLATTLGAGGYVPAPSSALLRIAVAPPDASSIVVHGSGFTPGGLVYIDVSARADTDLHTGAWVVASHEAWVPYQPDEPFYGNTYVSAGNITVALDVYADTVYGPNGSQDPALGYQPGVGAAWQAAVCAGGMDVQAFDVTAGAWSDRVSASIAC
jgi:hypothetical protein